MGLTEFKTIWRRSIFYRKVKTPYDVEKINFIMDFMLCDKDTAVSLLPELDELGA